MTADPRGRASEASTWKAKPLICGHPRSGSWHPPLAGGSDEPVVLPVEDSLDLHAFRPRDIPSVVEEYLRAAHQRRFREVRLIHGRGRGAQRRVVQSFLAGHPLVARFFDAPPERGGWGATVVVFKS